LQVAAHNWQFNVCQLLLAHGADVEARDWEFENNPKNPLDYACGMTYDHRMITESLGYQDFTAIPRLLIESGLDIHSFIEIEGGVGWLASAVCEDPTSRLSNLKANQAFVWLVQRYIRSITCDGTLRCTELHPSVCELIHMSEICYTTSYQRRDDEKPNVKLFTPNDTELFRYLLLFLIWVPTRNHEYEFIYNISPPFCSTYTGDFHYQQHWDLDGHSTITSPLELALRSFGALRTFHNILLTCRTDAVTFIEVECTMPWCTYTQELLMNLFTLQPQEYRTFRSVFACNNYCFGCDDWFQHEGLLDWDETIELVRSGRSLANLLHSLSKEELEESDESTEYCGVCEWSPESVCKSRSSQRTQEEDTDENMGFIEGEIGVECHNNLEIFGAEDERLVIGTDTDSDDDSSSRVSSDEDLDAGLH
jgi:hypothetical protein